MTHWLQNCTEHKETESSRQRTVQLPRRGWACTHENATPLPAVWKVTTAADSSRENRNEVSSSLGQEKMDTHRYGKKRCPQAWWPRALFWDSLLGDMDRCLKHVDKKIPSQHFLWQKKACPSPTSSYQSWWNVTGGPHKGQTLSSNPSTREGEGENHCII
jgi:hypothetical protein